MFLKFHFANFDTIYDRDIININPSQSSVLHKLFFTLGVVMRMQKKCCMGMAGVPYYVVP